MANPMMWAIGNEMTASSRRSCRPGNRALTWTLPSSPRWVSSTPFGLPVVPDV